MFVVSLCVIESDTKVSNKKIKKLYIEEINPRNMYIRINFCFWLHFIRIVRILSINLLKNLFNELFKFRRSKNYLSFHRVLLKVMYRIKIKNKIKTQDLYIFFLSYIYYISKKSILLHYTSESLEFYRSIFSTNHTIILIPPYLSLFHVLLKLIPKYQVKIKKSWIYYIYPFYLTRIKQLKN